MSGTDLRERVRRHTERNELPYRERGEHHTRLEAFSDAVLAFAITLSVLSLEVPHDSGELLELFRGLPSFLFTFCALFGVWTAQNRFCRRFGLDDPRTTWTFGAILFVIVFYTYPLKFMAAAKLDAIFGHATVDLRREDTGRVFALYGAGYGVLCSLFWSLYRHAWNLRDLLELDEAERLDVRLQMRNWGLYASFGLVLVLMIALDPIRGLAPPMRRVVLAVLLALVLGWAAVFANHVRSVQIEKRRFLATWRARAQAAAPGAGGKS